MTTANCRGSQSPAAPAEPGRSGAAWPSDYSGRPERTSDATTSAQGARSEGLDHRLLGIPRHTITRVPSSSRGWESLRGSSLREGRRDSGLRCLTSRSSPDPTNLGSATWRGQRALSLWKRTRQRIPRVPVALTGLVCAIPDSENAIPDLGITCWYDLHPIQKPLVWGGWGRDCSTRDSVQIQRTGAWRRRQTCARGPVLCFRSLYFFASSAFPS